MTRFPDDEVHMRRLHGASALLAAVGMTWLTGQTAGGDAQRPGNQPQQTVRDRETAFARTMADRDPNAFATFLSAEAIFFGRTTLRGRQEVADGWKRFFEGPQAPFSWRPEIVEVLDSGALALTSGP